MLVGPALSLAAAQATAAPKAKAPAPKVEKVEKGDVAASGTRTPLAQPATEPASGVPAGELALGSVRVPRKVMANGQPLEPGTYQVRLTAEEATGKAPGATPSYERFVEFLQAGKVKGKEVASIVAAADTPKVAKDKKPAPGASRVELLKGNDFMRVWINRGGNNYLIHLVVPATA